MWIFNSLIIAIAMYSKIPMPQAEWNEKNMRYAMCDDNGYIVGKTPQGCYMVEHLQLNLFRYAICWYLDRLREKISILKEVARDSIGDTLLLKLYDEYDKYENYLKDNL